MYSLDVPQIVAPVKNFTYTVNETSPVTIVCSASGIPAPKISWFRINNTQSTKLKNDSWSKITPSQVNRTYELPGGRGTAFLVTSTLTIPDTQDEDSGQYACQAVNEIGNETIEFELVVQGKLVYSKF